MQHGEKFNTITHLLGAIAALPGLVYLVVLAAGTADAWKITSVSIYGTTLLLLYSVSSFYHGHAGRYKNLLQKLDHLSIYLLIAGTYTPYMLVTLRGAWGWSILGVVWGLALIGIIIDTLPNKSSNDRRLIPLLIYLLMGWLIVIPLNPLAERFTNLDVSTGIIWLAIGGALYTLGVVFFVLGDRLKHAHGIWHLFVLGGSVSHYVSISLYVI